MKVTVHFVDGENLDGEAEQVSLDRGGFKLVGTIGNTRSAWVGAGAIKYIAVHAESELVGGEQDPRDGSDLTKVALHFLDGEVQHTYRDTTYLEQPGGFVVRLFEPDTRRLVKALVPGTSLKGVFVVDAWDSRTEEEKQQRTGTRRRRKAQGATGDEAATPRPMSVPAPAFQVPAVAAASAATQSVTAASQGAAPEERRLGFVPGLAKRRRPSDSDGPGQERHEALRMRISEVLGILGPPGDNPPG